jgi:hypothetical protein
VDVEWVVKGPLAIYRWRHLLITNVRQNLLTTKKAVNVALRCYSVQRFALLWNVLAAEFAELVGLGGEDTVAGCYDRV